MMPDNFNFICADCGPSEGDPAFTDERYNSYCAKCNPKRGKKAGEYPAGCQTCGEEDFSPNIEAFEISGKILCDECAEEVFEENSQFGAGA